MSGPVLVTGAAGFAGSHLLDLLVREHADVVGWSRPGGSPPRAMRGVLWQAVDLLDGADVSRTIAALRPSVVYHCAGAAHVGRSWEHTAATFGVNVRGTHHLLEALRDQSVRARVVIPGSSMVYAASREAIRETDPLVPSSPYGLSKLAQEMLGADAAPVDVLIARSFNHFGPRQDAGFAASAFARRIAEIEAGHADAVLAVGNLEARRDLTDVRDTVRAYRLLAERGEPGRPYNVCSGRAVEIGELLELLLSRAQVQVRVEVDPARYRPNDQPLVLGDRTRISTELGWSPVIPIEQTVEDLLTYWRQLEAAPVQ